MDLEGQYDQETVMPVLLEQITEKRKDGVVAGLGPLVGSEEKARTAVENVFADLAGQFSDEEIVASLEQNVGTSIFEAEEKEE